MSAGPAAIELRATYRLQLSSEFGFADARALVPYLRDLGISHLYLSPSLQARRGSTHGYDVVDPRRFSRELGGPEELRSLSASARAAGMGIVLDVVPNHLAADPQNRYWADPELRARFFDIEPGTGVYRRFFDIGELAGVRQEDPAVFEETHELVISLVREGMIDGLRVDHSDGLADPAGYLARLREHGVERVWIEKILDPGERLRDWPVCGTVGYEFLNDACALFVDPEAKPALTALWEQVSGDRRSFAEVAHEAKLEQVRGPFAQDVERLLRELSANLGDLRFAREGGESTFERADLEHALASLPVYRTYVDPVARRVDDADRRVIEAAGMHPAIASMLLLESDAPAEFVTRFQQTTPAITAKGVEDTAFYRYCRMISLNDVGGDPSRFGIDVGWFHAGCVERLDRFPLNLLTTQTHDAKRSADVRARIDALSSMPEEWATHVGRWFELTDGRRDGGAPDDVERYVLFQTLVGAWPIAADRIETYMEKALREAKRNTDWVRSNTDWEEAVKRFGRSLYADDAFLADFEPFARRVAAFGERASLGQLVLKLTAPGVPDMYEGDELAFRALVDPDNRRPVDFDWRQAMLRRLMGGGEPDDETRKLFVTLRLLGLRGRRPEPFAGSYEPLDAGPSTCAFVRGGDVLVAVAVRSGPVEGTVETPRGEWRDILRGEERSFDSHTPVQDIVGEVGIAVFERA